MENSDTLIDSILIFFSFEAIVLNIVYPFDPEHSYNWVGYLEKRRAESKDQIDSCGNKSMDYSEENHLIVHEMDYKFVEV